MSNLPIYHRPSALRGRAALLRDLNDRELRLNNDKDVPVEKVNTIARLEQASALLEIAAALIEKNEK